MAIYRKKPVEIEARLLIVGTYFGDWPDVIINLPNTEGAIVSTLEGPMKANYGDYIIKGIKGELYPCKPDIFHATYDFVRED